MKAASKVHDELVALRLFTGPMYVNKVLRLCRGSKSFLGPTLAEGGGWRICVTGDDKSLL